MNAVSRYTFLALAVLAAPLVPTRGQKRPSAAPGGKEPAAMAVLRQNQEAMAALRTYSAECLTIQTRLGADAAAGKNYLLGRLTAGKPNRMRYDGWELTKIAAAGGRIAPSGLAAFTFACDGKKCWKQLGTAYIVENKVGPERMTTIVEPWTGFYTPRDSALASVTKAGAGVNIRSVRAMGREKADGVDCDRVLIVSTSSQQGDVVEEQATWYFGPDHLVRRRISRLSVGGKPVTVRDSVVRHIRINAPVRSTVYTYTPPKGVALRKRPKRPPVLPNGALAPNFTARDARNRPVKLTDFRGKVVVLDFWASWCGPCMVSMPHNQDVVKRLKAQKLPVVLLAVDDGEPREDFDAWVKKNGPKLSALTFLHVPPSTELSGRLFRVSGIPCQFVLDRRGIVRASFQGYGGPTDDLENAIRSALIGKSTVSGD
jgi:thiol-disulfide isomerase/thioredoxin